jgi:ATP-dependent Clp protease ATP-binding subunit ClpA
VVVDLDDADAVKLEFSENEAPPAPAQEEAEA